MLEWLKRHAWKACILQKSIGGSNPPLSAKHLKLSAQRWAFSVQGRQELAPVRTCTEKAQGRKAMSFKCFARAPAASGKGKDTRSVANPAASGMGKGTLCVANPPRRAEGEKPRFAWLIPHGKRGGSLQRSAATAQIPRGKRKGKKQAQSCKTLYSGTCLKMTTTNPATKGYRAFASQLF